MVGMSQLPFAVGGGTEVALSGGGGDMGGDSDNDHSLRDPPHPIYILQLPWESPHGV